MRVSVSGWRGPASVFSKVLFPFWARMEPVLLAGDPMLSMTPTSDRLRDSRLSCFDSLFRVPVCITKKAFPAGERI